MITTNTADAALKSFYLDVLRNQLNTNTNPFYNKIVTTSKNIIGHKVVRLAPYALNGGFGFSSDSGNLPQAGSNKYTHFETTTKDMYGVIEISDKAMKASRLNTNSFVDLLTQEMKGILEAAKFNYSRALFTDGTGVIATVEDSNDNSVQVDSVKYLMEGMIIDIIGPSSTEKAKRIVAINRPEKIVVLDSNVTASVGDKITVQNSYQKEITGLGAILTSDTTQPLYGVDRSENYWMMPYISENTGAISDLKIQTAIDYLEENAGSTVDYISCSYDVRRNYLSYLELTRRNIDPMTLEGGFQAISFSGIPLVADRHCPDGTMDLLNSKSFAMHTLSDWDWLDDDGKILKQIAGKPAWTAVLAKYGELLCDHPGGQARLKGITA
ncbi:MAG: phage major capsid protein [Clostridia bacterium]|nr:phage major capsid protein [Clostridia bacterium]